MTLTFAICALTCALLLVQEIKLWKEGHKGRFAAVLLLGLAVMGLTMQQARIMATKETESAAREKRSDHAIQQSERRERVSEERFKKSEARAERSEELAKQTLQKLNELRDDYVTNDLITVIELDEPTVEPPSPALSEAQKQAQRRLAEFARPELEARCRGKDLQACKVLYREAKSARADQRDDVATHLFDISCNGGIDWACQNVGTYYFGRRDYEKALHYYALGCALNFEQACKHEALAKAQLGG